MKLLRAAALVVLAGFALTTCRLLKLKIDRARRMAEWRAREATEPRPQYWPIDEPWPAKDGPIMVVFETYPPFYGLRSGREVRGVVPGSSKDDIDLVKRPSWAELAAEEIKSRQEEEEAEKLQEMHRKNLQGEAPES